MIHHTGRSVSTVVLLCLIAALCYTEVRSSVPFAYYPLTISSIAIVPTAMFLPELSLVLLGVSLCVIPFFGNSGLSMFVTGWLLGFEIRQLFTRGPIDSRETRARALIALLGMLVLVLLALLEEYRSLQISYDPMLTSTLYQAGRLKGVLRYFLQQPRVWNDSPLVVAGYVLSTLLLAAVAAKSREERGAETLLYGLAVGTLISVLVMLAQLAGIHPSISFNRSAFWVMTGRFGASFSDPNALGIMAALLVPLLWHAPARAMPSFFRISSISLALSALWSGSRTFWLGMALWLLWIALCSRGREASRRRRFARLAFGAVCVMTAVIALPQTNDWLAAQGLPPSAQRVVQSLNLRDGSSMFASRTLFSRLAIQVWREAPLFGVGLGRFFEMQDDAAKQLGIELGGWRDNANNFYLQELSEGGLLGIALTLLAFYLFAKSLQVHPSEETSRTRVVRFLLFSLAMLLLTGPHLNFDEVRYLAVCLLGLGLSSAPISQAVVKRSVFSVYAAALVCPLLLTVFSVRPGGPAVTRGLYQFEAGSDGSFAWTGREARVQLCPTSAHQLGITLQALNPDLKANPLHVRLLLQDEQEHSEARELTLSAPGWTTVSFQDFHPPEGGERLTLSLVSSRVWSPGEGNAEGDHRWFGVMVRRPDSLCVR
ncbi:MAG: O-antigen ligase family protein [Bdellovibrionota bacterium]